MTRFVIGPARPRPRRAFSDSNRGRPKARLPLKNHCGRTDNFQSKKARYMRQHGSGVF